MKLVVATFALAVGFVSWNHASAQDQIVEIRLEVTDASGAVIEEAVAGSEFTLNGYVLDLREPPQGVFSAYADVTYSEEFVSVGGTTVAGPAFPNGISGDASVPGFIDEIGSFDGLMPADLGPLLLFSVPFMADEIGTAHFELDPADILPAHEVLVFGVDNGIPVEAQRFVDTSLNIVPEPTSVGGTAAALLVLLSSVRRKRR